MVKTCGATNLERLELVADVELTQSCVELASDAELESKSDASGRVIEVSSFSSVTSQSPNENKISYRRSAAR